MELEGFDLSLSQGGMVLLPPCNLVLGINKVMVFHSTPWTFVYLEENKQPHFGLLLTVGHTQPDCLVAANFSQFCFLQHFQTLLVSVPVSVHTKSLQFSKLYL